MSTNLSCNSLPLPPASDYINGLDSVSLALTITVGSLVLVVLFIYLEELLFMFTQLEKWHARSKAVALLAIYPVHSVGALLSLLIPRSATVNDMISGLYLSVCLYIFMHMLMGHYGGKEKMTSRLLGTEMSLRGPPCCCCCFCLPTITVTNRTVHFLEAMVFQYCFVRGLLSYISAIMVADERHTISLDSVASNNVVTSLSTILAMFGLILANRVSMEPLAHAKIRPKLYCIQLVLLVDNLQKSLFVLLGNNYVIPCGDGLSAPQNAVRFHRMLMVPELLLFSLIARHFYRRYTPDGSTRLQPRGERSQRLESYSSTTDIISHDVVGNAAITDGPTANGSIVQIDREIGGVIDDIHGTGPSDVTFTIGHQGPITSDA